MLFEELLLRPPGGGDAGRSRRRQKEDNPDLAAIALEERPELAQSAEVAQNRSARDEGLRAHFA